MNYLLTKLQELTTEFTLLPEQIHTIANTFHQTMLAGLAGKHSSLKMLPSYISKPSRDETGIFLALDFGGTNVRVLLTELLGQGHYAIHAYVASPLKDNNGQYNYISEQSTADQLFDFIATKISTLITPSTTYPLGHTFSFPTNQTALNKGTLLHWTKEIATKGVEGQDITDLLTAALHRKHLTNVLPQAIINDTVGTLLAAAYTDQSTSIGSICGTGHNTAYVEPCAPCTGQPMIINLESGNFDQLPFTCYDKQLDHDSEKPGSQQLEKMVSGHYIGELVRIIICSLLNEGLFANCDTVISLTKPYTLTGAHLSLFLQDTSTTYMSIASFLENTLHITGSTALDRQILKDIATLVSTRSARLVAATYIGILHHIDPTLSQNHNIAIDGSLYEKTPGYADTIRATLAEGIATDKVSITLIKDGSGIGAAIATAIAVQPDRH